MNESNFLGTIYAVNNSTVTVVLKDNYADTVFTPGAGQIGSFVIMPCGERSVVGSISSSRHTGLMSSLISLSEGNQVVEIQPIGTVIEGRFERGLSTFPAIGGSVYAAEEEELQSIFATYRDLDFSFGYLSVFEKERLYLNPNKFFAKHIALFGSTGSGKSYTVASIIQKIEQLENSHVIILDLHGEYPSAFAETGNNITITDLELPYWLMNFDELCETFIEENEPSAHNQMMILKEAVLDSKRGKNLNLRDYLTIDTPAYFDFLDVMARMRALDTERTLAGKEGPFYGQFTRFLVRLESKLQDRRYEFLFKPKAYRSSDAFPHFLTKLFSLDSGKRITILDLSRVPFDVINVLVSLLGRVIYDFNLWNKNRRDFPIMIVFEEAHTYLSMQGRSRAARITVERIAKEGRKYGVSCMIVSQRPAEISETIIAQCNNFIAMRLLNPHDQEYVRKLVPESFANFIDVLPTLAQGEAYIVGDAVAIPSRLHFDKPYPEPGGADIQFYEKWRTKESDTDVADVVNNWWKQIRT